MNYKLGELFCGPGGIAAGALEAKITVGDEEIGIEHAWASDYHRDTCDTYIHNICPDAPETVYCEDVRKLDISKLGEIDGFAFGFPCNDFSVMGKRKGMEGEFGPLYEYGVKVLNEYDPDFFVAENVAGLSREHGAALDQIITDLTNAGMGYNVTPHIYKAEDYGVPQKRHRLILVGISSRFEDEFNVPSPLITDGGYRTARQALTEPPIPDDASNHEKRPLSALARARLSYIPPGQGIMDVKLPKNLAAPGKWYGRNYQRFHPDKPAMTIISNTSTTQGFHWDELRGFTNREAARFQSFDDNFVFTGNWSSVRRQIGMAVSPRLARYIFTAVLKTLHHVSYPWVSANESWRLCKQGNFGFS